MLRVPVERLGMRSVGEFGFARSSSFLSEAPAAKASCPRRPRQSPSSSVAPIAALGELFNATKTAAQDGPPWAAMTSRVPRQNPLLLHAGRRIPLR